MEFHLALLCFVKMFLMYICDAAGLEEFVSVMDLSLYITYIPILLTLLN